MPVFKDATFEIVLDQYQVTETINLSKIGSVEDLKIGSETYKF
jgi:hypothetical protein